MDTNKMREQFERCYPIPAGCEWSEKDGRYRPVDGKYLPGFSVSRYEAYVVAWGAWRASREAVVVELPKHIVTMAGPVLYADDVRVAIEAQGLKVAP